MLTEPSTPTSQKREASPRWLWWAFAGAALLYGLPAIWLLNAYLQPAFDLALYDQALWLITKGETLITSGGIAVNSAHFSPIQFLVSPIAYVPGGANPELVLQALVLASGVFPAWKLGKALGRDARWFVLVYAIHPAIIGGSWFGWRPWNLAVAAFMWVVWWVTVNPTWIRISAAGLIMLIFREDLAIWVGLLALVLWLAKRIDWMTLIKSSLVLGTATAVVVFVILPALSFVDGYYFTNETQMSGGSGVDIAASAISRAIFLLGPLALMPRRINWLLMAPLAIPVVGLLIRGGNSLTTFFHYDMMFVPLLLLIAGLSTSLEFHPVTLVVASILVIVILGALRPFPPRGGGNPLRYDAEIAAAYDEARDVIDAHPDADSVSMALPQTMVPHYSERSNIFIYPFPTDVWRDLEGAEAPLSLHYSCPAPNVVVARPMSVSPAWNEILRSGYTRTDVASGQLSVWVSDTLRPDQPCSVKAVETR